jgi:phosphatidylinositol alpha-1,6-mannosyltransferase
MYRRLPKDHYTIAAGEHAEQESFDAGHALDLVRLPLAMEQWSLTSWHGLQGYGRAILAVRRLIRKRRIRMVHCGRCLPEGVMALALKVSMRVPYVCYVHGEDIGTALNSREYALLARRALRGASCCIANSRNSAQLLRDLWQIRPERVRVLNPGVDTNYFVPARRDLQTRRRLGWEGRHVVLTVGRLQQRKGHDMLIRALPAILKQIPGCHYAIVGEGEGGEQDSLFRLARECGVESNVQFLGNIDDATLLRCYQQCDLVALPNREINGDIEGFGMVLVEAQACGKPVVAGRSGGTAETMRDGLTGKLVACESPEPLAEMIVRLLESDALRESMGLRARDWVVEQFDWDKIATQARELFELQLNARRGSKESLLSAVGSND